MTDRPIIFSGVMMRALLAGRKTQTRRLATSPLRRVEVGDRLWVRESGIFYPAIAGGAGDLFRHDVPAAPDWGVYWSRNNAGPGASYSVAGCSRSAALAGGRRKVCPSIHMPRWASRLKLIVEGVRIEPLQSISEDDARAEGAKRESIGVPPGCDDQFQWDHGQDTAPDYAGFISAKTSFSHLWRSLHGDKSWGDNPFVVALTFRVEHGNIDQPSAA